MARKCALTSEPQLSGALARALRRFLIFTIAGFLVTATSMGVSFTADSGVTQVTTAATGGALPLVWSATYAAGNLPTAVTGAGTAGWKYGTVGTGAQSVSEAPVWPTVVAGQAGSVTTAGDIATIDATDTTATYLLVTIYITNMRALALTYNSYSLPFRIYSGVAPTSGVGVGAIAWVESPATDANGVNTANTYITNNSGYQTFKLATGAGKYYAVTLDSGGALYPFQTGATDAATTPALYITAQKTS